MRKTIASAALAAMLTITGGSAVASAQPVPRQTPSAQATDTSSSTTSKKDDSGKIGLLGLLGLLGLGGLAGLKRRDRNDEPRRDVPPAATTR